MIDRATRVLQRWYNDPVLLAKELFGVQLWRGQIEILRAIADHDRVAVRSGHKCGKSTSASIAALWFFLTRKNARVICTAPGSRQVNDIIWRDVTKLYHTAKAPIGGELHKRAENGLRWNARELIGFSTDEAEKMAGFSGENLLFIVDEASGVSDAIFKAIQGNRAGGAKILMLSNPTRVIGTFFEAFDSPSSTFKKIHLSSTDCAKEWPKQAPNARGLATIEWCNEMRSESDDDEDPEYMIRVRGEFPLTSDECVISRKLVEIAAERFEKTPAYGRLQIGVDTARMGGDATCVVWNRGSFASKPITRNKIRADQVIDLVRQVVASQRIGNEEVSIRVDTTGFGGAHADQLRIAYEYDGNVEIVDVNSSSTPTDSRYERKRDELWFGLREWLHNGAIPFDRDLFRDLTAPRKQISMRGKIKVEPKENIRKRLRKSTDLADALALAVYSGNETNVSWGSA